MVTGVCRVAWQDQAQREQDQSRARQSSSCRRGSITPPNITSSGGAACGGPFTARPWQLRKELRESPAHASCFFTCETLTHSTLLLSYCAFLEPQENPWNPWSPSSIRSSFFTHPTQWHRLTPLNGHSFSKPQLSSRTSEHCIQLLT